ncbi:universal stress protein [Pseudonocardia sp. RS010]|uniref:universal stress protein n=1 Tax=Pseudonocardia sp. RS010 TaxID=3385979 RepID=UPI0039A16831
MSTGNVVVGVDPTAESRAALRWAARYAELTGGTIRAVTVRDLPVQPGGPERMTSRARDAPSPEETRAAVVGRLDEILDEALDTDQAERAEKQILPGDPAEVLLDQSADAAVLVLGNAHHGALGGAVTGSVALQCLHHARCPVVLVPADERT